MGSALGFIYVSLFEGFGIPLVEAMHCEVPIITADVSSMPEVVGEAGIKVSPKSIEAIKNSMIDLYENEVKRNALIELGKMQKNKFSWEKSAQKLARSLAEIKC